MTYQFKKVLNSRMTKHVNLQGGIETLSDNVLHTPNIHLLHTPKTTHTPCVKNNKPSKISSV